MAALGGVVGLLVVSSVVPVSAREVLPADAGWPAASLLLSSGCMVLTSA